MEFVSQFNFKTQFAIVDSRWAVPTSWKRSTTVLIYKKCPESEPQNWRPISLQCTIYKVRAAVLAHCLASWALDNKAIHPAQNGFLQYEGCAEHSFLLRSVLEDSKIRNKNVTIVWLDLRNAFGSVQYATMWSMMHQLGIPTSFRKLYENIYSGSNAAKCGSLPFVNNQG